MQGVYINGRRALTKKELKEAAKTGGNIDLEATSMFGNEYGGPLDQAPDGRYTVVGPDPYNSRKWYATILKGPGGVKVT